ncbi:hypothetical protein [Botryobacter ruber]|uniref:hypothetical protein n=1 Tax=Botryobacter ruber TaxID=2171629 RepID=UPI000F64BA92|nr:hypothetical protein [Botryobacter ruber]
MLKYLHPLLLLLLFWQCQNDNMLASPETDTKSITGKQEFSLQVGEQVQVAGTPDKLQLKLQNLNDSRCPANANCVHYGSATVLLLATDSNGKTENIELCIGSCGSGPLRSTHTVTTLSGNTTYSITLKEVQPYPGLEQKGDVKKAILVVEEAS